MKLLVLLLTIGFSSGCMSPEFKAEIDKFHPLNSGTINENLFVIKDNFVNMFLIKKMDDYVVIDAGLNSNAVADELKKLRIDPDKAKAIFLTHTHFDHVASISLFPNAIVYISEPEEQMLFDKKTKLDVKHELLKDNETKNIAGIEIKTIIVPGHTSGSTCYLVDSKYLFTGDTLSLNNGQITTFNNPFNIDTKLLMQSLDKISDLKDISLLITAHYGLTDQYEKVFLNWQKDKH